MGGEVKIYSIVISNWVVDTTIYYNQFESDHDIFQYIILIWKKDRPEAKYTPKSSDFHQAAGTEWHPNIKLSN